MERQWQFLNCSPAFLVLFNPSNLAKTQGAGGFGCEEAPQRSRVCLAHRDLAPAGLAQAEAPRCTSRPRCSSKPHCSQHPQDPPPPSRRVGLPGCLLPWLLAQRQSHVHSGAAQHPSAHAHL